MGNEELLKPGQNTGFIEQSPDERAWIAGDGRATPTILLADGDATPYLPDRELQGGVYFDSMACVSFSALNTLETLANILLASGMVPYDKIQVLRGGGWIDANGKLNLSDRFTAKMSGTRRTGNTMEAVWNSIRSHGVLPEADWSFPREQRQPVFDWNDYYAPIPQELQAKALQFLDIFDINFQWMVTGGRASLSQYKNWLKNGPLHVAGPICAPWNVGPVPACGQPVSHATMLYKADTVLRDFDHYDPVQKALAVDYPLPWVIQPVMFAKGGPRVSPLDPALGRKLAGQLLLNVDDRGALWYVTPGGKRAKIGNDPVEVEAFLQALRDGRIPHVGINGANLIKIPMI